MLGRFQVFILVLGVFCLDAWTSHGGIGASSQCIDSRCLVTASSSIGSILLALGLTAFLLLHRHRETWVDGSQTVGIWRRFGAFLLDFTTVLLVVTPVGALPILIAEGTPDRSIGHSRGNTQDPRI